MSVVVEERLGHVLCFYDRASFRMVINTSQQDFGTRKVYCVSNVSFHAESKYAIKIFPITHSFCKMDFLIIDFSEFLVFSSVIFFIHEQIF